MELNGQTFENLKKITFIHSKIRLYSAYCKVKLQFTSNKQRKLASHWCEWIVWGILWKCDHPARSFGYHFESRHYPHWHQLNIRIRMQQELEKVNSSTPRPMLLSNQDPIKLDHSYTVSGQSRNDWHKTILSIS